jgi:hypothetical protein
MPSTIFAFHHRHHRHHISNMMTWLIYCIIFRSFAKEPFPGSNEIVDNRCFNYLKKCTKLADKHIHLWCEQLIKSKFPQCAPANLKTSCLLEIGDFYRKLQLRCSCQFPSCAVALRVTLRLAVYRQSVCLSDKSLETHDQQFFSTEYSRS